MAEQVRALGREVTVLIEPVRHDTTPAVAAALLSWMSLSKSQTLEIIEIQTGSYLGEDDIERFEDVYCR